MNDDEFSFKMLFSMLTGPLGTTDREHRGGVGAEPERGCPCECNR